MIPIGSQPDRYDVDKLEGPPGQLDIQRNHLKWKKSQYQEVDLEPEAPADVQRFDRLRLVVSDWLIALANAVRAGNGKRQIATDTPGRR